MKASVQYNDFVGTSAADISDFQNLEDVLVEWGVDTNRFHPVGVTFNTGDTGHCFFSILCKDETRADDKIVKVSYYKDSGYSLKDVMKLFKRFEVIVSTEEVQDRELEDIQALVIE